MQICLWCLQMFCISLIQEVIFDVQDLVTLGFKSVKKDAFNTFAQIVWQISKLVNFILPVYFVES